MRGSRRFRRRGILWRSYYPRTDGTPRHSQGNRQSRLQGSRAFVAIDAYQFQKAISHLKLALRGQDFGVVSYDSRQVLRKASGGCSLTQDRNFFNERLQFG